MPSLFLIHNYAIKSNYIWLLMSISTLHYGPVLLHLLLTITIIFYIHLLRQKCIYRKVLSRFESRTPEQTQRTHMPHMGNRVYTVLNETKRAGRLEGGLVDGDWAGLGVGDCKPLLLSLERRGQVVGADRLKVWSFSSRKMEAECSWWRAKAKTQQ